MEPHMPLLRIRGMETEDWDPERVRAALRGHAAAPPDDESAAPALADRALFLLGRGHAGIESEFAAFYPTFAARVAIDVRRSLFERIRGHARSGLLRSDVLVHFLRLESDRAIVAEAAFDVARLDVAAAGGEPRGADHVLELVVTGAAANTGAALGGLLALACNEVNRKLALLRPALARPEADCALAELARCARAPVHVATVEFWLDWMEALAGSLPGAQRVFDCAAEALVTQRRAVRGATVFDGSWIARPLQSDDHELAGARELPLGRFCGSIAPRLAGLAAAAPYSASLQRALEAWALVH
jgi:hypothetical protein